MRRTADEQLVVIHGATVDRTTDGTGAVADLTLAQLRALDTRAQFTDWPQPCRIPTFAEVLAATADFSLGEVEIKPDRRKRLEVLVPKGGRGHRCPEGGRPGDPDPARILEHATRR